MPNKPKVALLSHGDREARDAATFEGSRYRPVAEALGAVDITAEPAIYNDDFADEVRQQLLGMEGVLVWRNPIEQGSDRSVLDALLREVANTGVFVSAHPDVILKMGTKEVLYQTRGMSWGSDTDMYRTPEEMKERFPARLASGGGPRVLKQYRGCNGNGVWKVERHPTDASLVRVRHALRGNSEQDMSLESLFEFCQDYFQGDGRLIDQPYQERLTEGMVRCYLVQDKVTGFGHQAINALYPAPSGAPASEAPPPGPRLYHPPDKLEFQAIRARMETEGIGEMCRTLDLSPDSLPMIWDADFLYGPKTADGDDTWVLCEINVSAVSPFPDSALVPLAAAVKERLQLLEL